MKTRLFAASVFYFYIQMSIAGIQEKDTARNAYSWFYFLSEELNRDTAVVEN